MSVIHQHVPLLRQHPQLRQFLLTNLVEVEGRYVWRVNLEAISHHLEDIMSFPDFHKPYPGPTLFLGGSNSPYIRWDRKQVCGLTPRDPLQLLRVRGSPRRGEVLEGARCLQQPVTPIRWGARRNLGAAPGLPSSDGRCGQTWDSPRLGECEGRHLDRPLTTPPILCSFVPQFQRLPRDPAPLSQGRYPVHRRCRSHSPSR